MAGDAGRLKGLPDAGNLVRAQPGQSRTYHGAVQAAQDHLQQQGVPFKGPIEHDGPLSIYFNDPDGHPLEITCYP